LYLSVVDSINKFLQSLMRVRATTPESMGFLIMAKRELKEMLLKEQNGQCELSDVMLAEDVSMIDTDRINPKVNGGIYTVENTRIVDPVAHMKRHGNYRERENGLAKLKILIDAREQLRKFENSCGNRILAMKRGTDLLDKETLEFLEEQQGVCKKKMGSLDRRIQKHLKSIDHPFIESAFKIRGLGPITIAYLMAYIDINKAEHASSLWAYCGYDKASHERYEKGVSGGGNKTLRTVLYTMADSMIKTRSQYRDIYDREKELLSVSKKITKSRNTQGKLIDCAWCDTKPCHRHGAAIRKLIKIFLSHVWHVWRTVEGLPTNLLYVEEVLGHKNIIHAEELGWEY